MALHPTRSVSGQPPALSGMLTEAVETLGSEYKDFPLPSKQCGWEHICMVSLAHKSQGEHECGLQWMSADAVSCITRTEP